MSQRLVVLDESTIHQRHRVHGVGGVVVAQDDVLAVERHWLECKDRVGLDGPTKFSNTVPEVRRQLIALIADFPILCVAALLEDFRPQWMREHKETRSDAHVQLVGFEYVLQRLVEKQYDCRPPGPHQVWFDERGDLDRFVAHYEKQHPHRNSYWGREVPSLRDAGFSASLAGVRRGPLVEIADFVISGMTAWAGARCRAHRGSQVNQLVHLDETCAGLAPLFPHSGSATPPRRRGWSLITHREARTGNELLGAHIDRWVWDAQRANPVVRREAA